MISDDLIILHSVHVLVYGEYYGRVYEVYNKCPYSHYVELYTSCAHRNFFYLKNIDVPASVSVPPLDTQLLKLQREILVLKASIFMCLCKNIFLLYDGHELFLKVHMREENVEYEQLAAFVATTQLLANYKLPHVCHESPAGIEEAVLCEITG